MKAYDRNGKDELNGEEKDRLGKFHKYDDGTVDQPFLTPDTVRE